MTSAAGVQESYSVVYNAMSSTHESELAQYVLLMKSNLKEIK